MLSFKGKGGEIKKPLAMQRQKSHSIAPPNAYEVSCRAQAWKCPIPGCTGKYAPIVVPPHPFPDGFRLLFRSNLILPTCVVNRIIVLEFPENFVCRSNNPLAYKGRQS
ncbi:MAG: hypothetical protein A2Y81_07370 [Nitrospirae bacterium RBG_13_43_8]|nr:MAG: hypothetical protein A2Y81_07370 [Nitrospirae bacterium RBG_13_43_8]